MATCKTVKLEYCIPPYTKINTKWIYDLNLQPETRKILAENIGNNFSDIDIFLDMSPKARETETKNYQTTSK